MVCQPGPRSNSHVLGTAGSVGLPPRWGPDGKVPWDLVHRSPSQWSLLTRIELNNNSFISIAFCFSGINFQNSYECFIEETRHLTLAQSECVAAGWRKAVGLVYIFYQILLLRNVMFCISTWIWSNIYKNIPQYSIAKSNITCAKYTSASYITFSVTQKNCSRRKQILTVYSHLK